MALDDKILVVKDARVELEELSTADTETLGENEDGNNKDQLIRKSKLLGDITPMIHVNDFRIPYSDILRVEISETDFLPTVMVKIRDTKGIFNGPYFPKDDPVLQLYISSKTNKFKAIRNDYLITEVIGSGIDSTTSDIQDGSGRIYLIFGILYVPGLLKAYSKSYKNKTSYDTLLDVAGEFNLGFATNEEKTQDNMTWISPYLSGDKFAQYVTQFAYKTDDDYYMSFIDKYYNLNFINVNGILKDNFDFEKTYSNLQTQSQHLRGDGSSGEETDNELGAASTQLILSNLTLLQGSSLHITSYKQNTQQGEILKKIGKNTNVIYYDPYVSDNPKDNYIQYNISGFDSLNVSKEDLNDISTAHWMGIDYGNNHDNYMFAKTNNFFNLLELKKMDLEVETSGVNLNVIRGMRIPVLLLKHTEAPDVLIDSAVDDPDEDDERNKLEKALGFKTDSFLSDYYVIMGITYIFDLSVGGSKGSMFSTELKLSRKSWKASPKKLKKR